MAVVNEHPDVNVRTLYAGEVAAQTGLAVADLVEVAKRRRGGPVDGVTRPTQRLRENAEFAALTLLAQDWDAIAQLAHRGALPRRRRTVGRSSPWPPPTATSPRPSTQADPDARDVLERAAVADLDVEPEVEAQSRSPPRSAASSACRSAGDPARIRDDAEARLQLEELAQPMPPDRRPGGC